MVKDAEKTLKQIKRREEVDLRNEADSLVFQVEKTITDLGDNISEDDKKNAEEKKMRLNLHLKVKIWKTSNLKRRT